MVHFDWHYAMWNDLGKLVSRTSILATLILSATTSAQSQVRSGLQSGLRSGYDHHKSFDERMRYSHYHHTSCWRFAMIGKKITRVWDCQPYPPP